MNLPVKVTSSLDWGFHSVRFFKNHFWEIFGLGMIAALGRAAQLGAFGQLPPWLNFILEVLVELARILIFLYTLGLTNIKAGMARLVRFFTDKRSRRQNGQSALRTLRRQWAALLLNVVFFSVIALLINRLIDHIAYQTCLYANLIASEIIAEQASVWVLILFFKNISVIPFTLVFNALFLFWLINRLPKPISSADATAG